MRVRDLSRDSLLVFTVRDGAGAIVAAASLPVFDGRGVFRGGLQKLALHDDAEAAEAELEAAHARLRRHVRHSMHVILQENNPESYYRDVTHMRPT